MLCIFFGFTNISAQVEHSGTISFRSGEVINYEYLGSVNNIKTFGVRGNLGSQFVTYNLSELSEVIFINPNADYRRNFSDIIIVNKNGKRYTLTDAYFYILHKDGPTAHSQIVYVFRDPVTNNLKTAPANIRNNVYSITIGNNIGKMRFNPKSGEYFPSTFIYDPYTGDKLVWASR